MKRFRIRLWVCAAVLPVVFLAASGAAAPMQNGKAEEAPATGTAGAASGTTGLSQAEQDAVANYLRHLYGWSPQQIELTVTVSPDSPIPPLRHVIVEASNGEASRREELFLSADGRFLIRGELHALDKDPYQSNRDRIVTDGQPATGSSQAPVTLVIYSDFQCEFCSRMSELIRGRIPEAYKDTVRIVYKDFPLSAIHPWAMRAAVVGRAIYRVQPEMFWRYHDWMFENQSGITVETLPDKVREFAEGNGMDLGELLQAMEAPEASKAVEQSIREGLDLGVQSTPTLFINGRPMVGSQPFERLKLVLDWEIEHSQASAK